MREVIMPWIFSTGAENYFNLTPNICSIILPIFFPLYMDA